MNGKAHPEPWGGGKKASVLPTFFLVGSGGISCCFITDSASFMAISEQMLFALVRVKAGLSTHFGKEVSAFLQMQMTRDHLVLLLPGDTGCNIPAPGPPIFAGITQ